MLFPHIGENFSYYFEYISSVRSKKGLFYIYFEKLFFPQAITNRCDNAVYYVRAITVRSDNGSYMLRAITIRSDNYSRQYKSIMQ
jgi:hypothetical protein